ncbi:MAG: GNAT family N-acetyltransferase [Mariniblastus sp.]|nr:GNAT family N-acetyltransferase [Mariniblastus sp.]
MTDEFPSKPQDLPQPAAPQSVPHPILRAGRLVLRPLESADAPRVQEICRDRGIAATTRNVPHPYPEGAALLWIESHPELWSSGKAAVFGICLDEDQGASLVGAIGLEINPLDHHAEIGYWLSRECWGQGICTEAVEVIVRFGFEQLGLQRIHAICMASNPASGRVLEKNGLIKEGRLRNHIRKWGVFHDVDVYGILRRDSDLVAHRDG